MKPATILRITATCGLVGPVILVAVLIILGALYPGYSHISQTMSVLGAVDAPHKAIMNTLGFPLLALSIVMFAHAVHHGVNLSAPPGGQGKVYSRFSVFYFLDRAGPALIVMSGVALAMTGIFPGDPANIDVSWRGTTHSIFAAISAVSFAIAPVFIGIRQWSDNRWKGHALYSEITAVVTLALSWISSLDAVDAYVGLFQRISMGIPMVWMMVTSAKIVRTK